MNDINPVFKPVTIDLQRLCNGDMSRDMKLEVMHWEKDDKFIEIGHYDVNVTPTTLTMAGHSFVLKHPRGENRPVGHITVGNALVVRDHTFQNYVDGGLEISMIAAVDFTGSNGDPDTPDTPKSRSLHYYSAGPTAYQVAINAVAKVLAPYDSDGKIELYGFGGVPKGAGVSHCFPLNGNERDPKVDGVDGMNEAYVKALKSCNLAGPTNCAPVITKATASAKAAGAHVGGPLSYGILLLLTDGEIDDMSATVEAIKAAASVPLSIVVCGIGSENFAKARALNNVTGASRDIVQFVRMEDFGAGAASRLAAKVLEKLPDQVETYFKKAGIAPGKK